MINTKNICRVVVVASNAELLSEHYYCRLWLAVRNKEFHRRDWLDELADAFLDVDTNIELAWPSGKLYDLPEIDDVFGDAQMRWLSEYLLSSPRTSKPKIRSPKLERLWLLDLYFRIKYPHIAAHFGR